MAVVDLSTTADAKIYMNISVATWDTLIGALVSSASKMIEDYTGRKLKAADYTLEVYDGQGDFRLYLKQYPINTVAALQNYDPVTEVVLYTYTEADEFIIHTSGHYLRMWGGFHRGTHNYRVSYNGGYTTLPESIELACNMLTAWLFDKARKQGLKSHRLGSFAQAFSISDIKNGMPDEIRTLLDQYVKPNI